MRHTPPSSPRLTYHRVREGDATPLLLLATDAHVRRFLLDGELVSRDWARATLAASDALFDAHGVGLWLVRLADHEAPVGFCGFHVFPEVGPTPQLFYALLETFTGVGLATEIGRALVLTARANAGWATIESAVDGPNRASVRVLEKLGFLRTATLTGAFGPMPLFHLGLAARVGLDRSWDGRSWDGAPAQRVADVDLAFDLDTLTITVDAHLAGDPPPAGPPGPTPRLWEHEVVEIFLLGDDDRYLEVELGPHGHHLALALHGRRRVTAEALPITYEAAREDDRWRGVAHVPAALLPPGLDRANVCAIHGQAPDRRYLSWQPLPGPAPDFHQLDRFAPLPLRRRG